MEILIFLSLVIGLSIKEYNRAAVQTEFQVVHKNYRTGLIKLRADKGGSLLTAYNKASEVGDRLTKDQVRVILTGKYLA